VKTYPSGMVLRPIVVWPRAETRNRVRSTFSASWSATLDLLDRELYHLGRGCHHAPAVLQIAMREEDFRLDGMPRASAVPTHPGVILNVESTKGPLSFPCDKFDRWRDNLRAIALGLEALRRVDRYGITPGNEQYRGWRAIEAAPTDPAMTAEQLINVLAAHAELITPVADSSPENLARIYRTARANTHPDRPHGDRAAWDRVETIAEQLRRMGWLP
jgi:hypothetical protein